MIVTRLSVACRILRRRLFDSRLSLPVLVGLALTAGCSSTFPETGHVQGTVTYAGEALPQGEVQFLSEDGHVATGRIAPDGSYRLSTFAPDDGAVTGYHRVMVRSLTAQPEDKSGSDLLVPVVYENPKTSTLSAEVQTGANTINIHLEAPGE